MKRITLIILIALSAKLFGNPSFTIGSNYYLTVFAYPHDIMYWPDQAFFSTSIRKPCPGRAMLPTLPTALRKVTLITTSTLNLPLLTGMKAILTIYNRGCVSPLMPIKNDSPWAGYIPPISENS